MTNLAIAPLRASSLKEAAADELRRRIIDGSIKTGSKLTERDVALMLGIGRMPAREALMALEHEGLITSNSDSRYVIELTQARILSLYQVRYALEKMAVVQAAENTNTENRLRLDAKLKDLHFACARQDASLTTPADLALHEEIWAQADSPYLQRCLLSMRGVIFLVVMQGSLFGPRNWDWLYAGHQELVAAINDGKPEAAAKLISRHFDLAAKHSIKVEQIIAKA